MHAVKKYIHYEENQERERVTLESTDDQIWGLNKQKGVDGFCFQRQLHQQLTYPTLMIHQ